jgi:hypothetical protein
MKWRGESSLTKDEEEILASLLPEADLAAQLGVTVRTTRNWRNNRDAPPWCRIGRDVFFFRERIKPWLEARMQAPLRQRKAAR